MAHPLLIAPDDCRDVCHNCPDCAIGANTKLQASQPNLMRDWGPHQTASNSAELNVRLNVRTDCRDCLDCIDCFNDCFDNQSNRMPIKLLQKTYQQCTRNAPGMCQECKSNVIGMQYVCNRNALGMHKECARNALGMRHECARNVRNA